MLLCFAVQVFDPVIQSQVNENIIGTVDDGKHGFFRFHEQVALLFQLIDILGYTNQVGDGSGGIVYRKDLVQTGQAIIIHYYIFFGNKGGITGHAFQETFPDQRVEIIGEKLPQVLFYNSCPVQLEFAQIGIVHIFHDKGIVLYTCYENGIAGMFYQCLKQDRVHKRGSCGRDIGFVQITEIMV